MGIVVLGGHQTDFARHTGREGTTIGDLMAEAAMGACERAGVAPAEIEVGHVGNFVGEVLAGQGHLGGLLGEAHDDLVGLPVGRHEAACASGSIAVLSAMADLEAGRYDVALVVGVEVMRPVGVADASRALGLAAMVPDETAGVAWPWPSLFSDLGDVYEERYGLDRDHLAAIARQNFTNAKRNPNAQTRDWILTDAAFAEDDQANPLVAGRIRRQDCSQITDGAAAVILATDDWARRHGAAPGRTARLAGWGHRTARMRLADKLADAAGSEHVLPHLAATIRDALDRAGTRIEDVRGIEAHDCFTTTEYAIIDHAGLTPPGKSFQAIEDGVVAPDGSCPVNPSGGLIGAGHPVGATGIRMVLDATRQVTGTAGEMQVPDADRFLTVNVGGSTTTCCSFVVERGDLAAGAMR